MDNFTLTKIDGGICAAEGFYAEGIHSGLRKNTSRLDLALIKSVVPCSAAGVFTKNKVFAAPVGVTKKHLKNGKAQAIICNSGNANACTCDGYKTANETCAALAEALDIPEDDVIVASTGVIGISLDTEPIKKGIPTLIDGLTHSVEASDKAASAIMTTDTKKKEFAYSCEIDGKTVKIGGICKGSGMIHPNMGTMLCFITTDCAVSPDVLQDCLKRAIDDTYNMVTVDGDTSTNDTVVVLASGLSGNREITDVNSEDAERFFEMLHKLCRDMALAIAADGEGATKLLICTVNNAKSRDDARTLAKAVVASSLVKTAMYGADANWGRIICALGYSGAEIDPAKIDITFESAAGTLPVCKNGGNYPFDEDYAKKVLSENEIKIICDMNDGEASASAFGCDLTYEYVRINGDYRS